MSNDLWTWVGNAANVTTFIQIIVKCFAWILNKLGRCPSIMKATKPLFINSNQHNHKPLDAKFLDFEKCTLMLWVFVPEQGNALRSGVENSYLISHMTDGVGEIQRNLFAIRYSPARKWELVFTNEIGSKNPQSLSIDDSLSVGWHHFWVSWDKLNSLIKFSIDGGINGEAEDASFIDNFVNRHTRNATVGSWLTTETNAYPYQESYCNTYIKDLWICERIVEPGSRLFNAHMKLKPK